MKKIAIFLIFLFFLVPTVLASRLHYIYDNADVVDSTWENKINEFASKVDTNTTTEIVCITLTSLDKMSIDEAREYYFNDVPLDGVKGIGKSGKDNGVLIILAMNEREWGIEVGYGLEGQLTDGECGRIGRDVMTPKLKEGKTGEALFNSMVAIAKEIGYSLPSPPPNPEFTNFLNFLTIILLYVAVIIISVGLLLIFFKSIKDKNKRERERNEEELERSTIRYEFKQPHPRKEHECPHCKQKTMCKVYGDTTREEIRHDWIWLITFSTFICLVCNKTFQETIKEIQLETVADRMIRIKMAEEKRRLEEERRRKEEKEKRERRRRYRDDNDYHSSWSSGSSGHSGGFGGGSSGGGGASGRW